MSWVVELYPLFAEEFKGFSEAVQESSLAQIGMLEAHGPHLGRPAAVKNGLQSNSYTRRMNASPRTSSG